MKTPKTERMLFGTKKIRTRIAPSPTGNLHIGTARTAFFNHLFARQHNGEFYVRIEDTDKERSKKEFENDILEGLGWLGLNYDGLIRQSERTEIYKKYLKKLVESGKAYISPEEKDGKTNDIIRFKNPNGTIIFTDLIRGEISFETKELGDFVIARNIESPLYHLAVVVDDHEMEITHVIRGEDHISNTPRQILILEALGFERPCYAHIPLILAKDRSKLSKRHGAVSLLEYKDEGYLPEAMLNFMALLGWSPQENGTESEILSPSEIKEKFSLEKIGKSGAIFDQERLNWINKEYLKMTSDDEFEKMAERKLPENLKNSKEFKKGIFHKITPILKERIVKLSDIEKLIEDGELEYYFNAPTIDSSRLYWKKDENGEIFKSKLSEFIKLLQDIPENNFKKEELERVIFNFIGTLDKGSILWPMRYALTGKDKSPDPFSVASIIGKDETVKRLKAVL